MRKLIFDIETKGLDLYISPITAIGVFDIDERKVMMFVVDKRNDEKKIIRKFFNLLGKSDKNLIIGYNIKRFDLPHVKSRAIVHDIPSKVLNSVQILDLSEVIHSHIFGVFGVAANSVRRFRLEDVCRLFNISKNYNLSGLMMTQTDSTEMIVEHLSDDLWSTLLLYERLKNHFDLP